MWDGKPKLVWMVNFWSFSHSGRDVLILASLKIMTGTAQEINESANAKPLHLVNMLLWLKL